MNVFVDGGNVPSKLMRSALIWIFVSAMRVSVVGAFQVIGSIRVIIPGRPKGDVVFIVMDVPAKFAVRMAVSMMPVAAVAV